MVSRKMCSDGEITIENLLMLFEQELVAREHASNPYTSHSQGQRSQGRGRHSTLLSGAHELRNYTCLSCCYYQQQHAAKDCTTVSGVSARKQILRNNGRCFNCLRKGHVGRLCRSASRV